jgi:hypothetical protein
MLTIKPLPAGGYRFISHQFQYSGGVAAEPGFSVERARFARPLPLARGFDAIEAYLAGIGRSPTAFCACELRSPTQFTDAGFVAFNRRYVERLAAWGIFRDEVNPVARSNVCPEIDPRTAPSFYAFSYTVPSANSAMRSFVAAGSGEAREGAPSYEGRIKRRGDQSPDGMREKRPSCWGQWSGHGGARLRLDGCDRDPGLLDLRHPSDSCRRVRTLRSHPGRFDVALRASACAGPRFRG